MFNEQLSWLDAQSSSMLSLVSKWAANNSGSHNTDGLRTQADLLENAFGILGGKIERVILGSYEDVGSDGQLHKIALGDALRITKRPDAKHKVFLAGHMDTVFGVAHPFQKVWQAENNVLRGPGVADLKGGLAVMLFALQALEKSAVANQIGWEILINSDEEIGSPGSAKYFQEAATRHELGLVFEPSLPDGKIVSSRKGAGKFSFVVKGRAAHSGRSHADGRSAIKALSEIVLAIEAFNGKFGDVTFNVGRIAGGGALNIVPDNAVCHVDVRTTDPTDEPKVLAAFDSIIQHANSADGINVTSHGHFDRAPKKITPQIQKLFDSYRDCAAQLGEQLDWAPSGGCCDGNNLAAAGLPNLDTLGVRGGNIHSAEEYLLIDSLVGRAKLTALFLMRLAAGDFL